MKVVIGTYRGQLHLPRLIGELENRVHGIDELIFVDDSGSMSNIEWESQFGLAYPVEIGKNAGYTKAMDKVCDIMRADDDDYLMFWEEDFLPVEDIVLEHLADELRNDPTLAQVVLPRQPWYENEIEHGDVIAAMSDRLDAPVVIEQGVHNKLWVHQATFSCNPAVWAPMAYRWPWPQCDNSEEEKTRYLVNDDEASFAFYGHRVQVWHDGKRTGHGY